ncbi:MAG: ATP-binding protein, partial [Thermotoga sp.]
MEVISLSFPAKAENIRIARTVVRNFLLLKKVFEEDIFDTELALDEAVSNIIVHTYKKDESKYIVMTLTWKDDKNELEILLRDFGPKVDPSKI